jgi:ABC-2 type transport system permease protein
MKPFLRLCRWEIRHLLRDGQAWLVCGALLAAALVAIWVGDRRLARHRAEIAALPGHYDTQMADIAKQFTPQGEAGYIAYYTFFPTHHAMTPLAGLAIGVRDLVPNATWVRLLGLEGQLYEADLGNPALQALGNFDLAFVFCALAPLALLVLAHDALTRERESGRFPLLAAQGGSLAALLAARVGVRALTVALTCTVAFGLACAVLRIPLASDSLGWLAGAWAHLAVWAGLAALVAVVARTPAASLAAALTGWIVAVVLLPALLNLGLATALPVSEGLELTVRQRQESHSAWDKPRAETMDKFFAHNPDWSGTPPVTGRFAWKWYYAMQQVGDDSVATESAAYRENLRSRQRVTARLAWLVPSAYAQLLLSARAGTDLDAHLAYLDRVRAFHADLRAYFYPMFFSERTLTPADYAAFPQFRAGAAPPPSGLPLWPLLTIAVGAFAATAFALRRSTVA